MNKETITKASNIIFGNEGGYGSVNADDNGAVSVGRLQWHATRALNLLKKIVKALGEDTSKEYLGEELYSEICTSRSWSGRVADTLEAAKLGAILSTDCSKQVQDEQAEADVTSYLTHIESLGVTDEAAQIFMADIENQGGSGASTRIIVAAVGKDLDSLYIAARADSVFSRYMSRRDRVYTKLTGHAYGEEPYDGELYEVRGGDTLSAIAQEYGTTVNAIAELNGISNPDYIRTGSLLKIPKAETESEGAPETAPDTENNAPESTEDIIHIVERGDKLSVIAAKYGTTWRALAEYNKLDNPHLIYAGQQIKIPSDTSEKETAPAAVTYHRVVRGDTLSALAQKYGTTVAAIVTANKAVYPTIAPSYIVTGWTLTIPKEGT